MNINIAVVGVDVTNFVAFSKSSKEALKSTNLLKSVQINCLIEGEIGTEKSALSKYILPNAPIITPNNFDDLVKLSSVSNSVIISDFDTATNLQKLYEIVSKNKIRVIAISKKRVGEEVFD